MRGHQLRSLLSDISRALGASSGAKHAAAFEAAQRALVKADDAPVEQIAKHVSCAAVSIAAAPWEKCLSDLQGAGISEADFLRLLAELAADKSIQKADVFKIAEGYVGYADKRASRDKLLDAIKTRFYGKIYDHDANEMAKRATPW